MLVVELYVLIEWGNVCVLEVPVNASVPNLPTHGDSAVIVCLADRTWVDCLVSVGRLQRLMVNKVLVVLGNNLVNWRGGSPSIILATLLLPVGVRWYVRIVLSGIPHLCCLGCYR